MNVVRLIAWLAALGLATLILGAILGRVSEQARKAIR